MKRSVHLLALLVLGSLPLATRAADISDPFEEFYTRHERAGTLLTNAYVEARQRGWEPAYARALITRFKGWAGLGLELTVSPDAQQPPRAGSFVRLHLKVTNQADGARQIVTGGSCHSVHTAYFMVLQPDGTFATGIGRPKGGGGHCFCTQRESVVQPGQSVELEQSRGPLNDEGWRPAKPGRYYVIAQFSTPASISYSVPTPIDVQ